MMNTTVARYLPPSDATVCIEVSGDLQTWSSVPALEIASTATTDTITARDPVPASDAARRFMRIRVTRAP